MKESPMGYSLSSHEKFVANMNNIQGCLDAEMKQIDKVQDIYNHYKPIFQKYVDMGLEIPEDIWQEAYRRRDIELKKLKGLLAITKDDRLN